MAGQTSSTNFPLVNARQGALGGSISLPDAFVAKYNPSGTVVFSTYLGGSSIDGATGAAIDGAGYCYVTGSTLSNDFPTANAAQGASTGVGDAFVTNYDAIGSNYLYSTYLGGSRGDTGAAIAVSSDGVAHVTGHTDSHDFPVLAPTQPELKDLSLVLASSNAADSFARTALTGLSVTALAVDPANNAVVYAGTTNGIYKTSNAGSTWTRVDSGLLYTDIQALAIDPNAPCTIYAGVNTTVASNVNTSAALVLSTNCGVTWGVAPGPLTARTVRSLAFTFSTVPTLYMGVIRNNGTVSVRITASHDGRPPRSSSRFPGFGNYVVAVDPQNACIGYAGDAGSRVFQNTSCSTFSWTAVGASSPEA